jgi:hypothetical protein
VIYIYCILPGGRNPPAGLSGIAGAAVEAHETGGLLCWASRLHQPPGGAADTARAHNAVVVAAMDDAVTPVPLRFGQTFADADAMLQAVAARGDEWQRLLHHFAGRAEYGVRIARAAQDSAGDSAVDRARDVHAAGAASGTAYMAALRRRHAAESRRRAAAVRIADQVRDRAGARIADARVEPAAAGQDMVSLAHLVAWGDAEAYHAVMREVRMEMSELRFLFTGPWPPYSFVE